jgi:hypothetical protein
VVVGDELVADVVTVTVLAGGLVTAALVELFDPPHAESASAANGTSRIVSRRMRWGSVGTPPPPPRFIVASACDHCHQ